MLGFMPGFPFLGGLDEKLFKDRLDNPRTNIPGGSVGIGGEQTGVYPFDSPGGGTLSDVHRYRYTINVVKIQFFMKREIALYFAQLVKKNMKQLQKRIVTAKVTERG